MPIPLTIYTIGTGGPLKLDGSSHLPPPVAKGSAHIRCCCRGGGANVLAQDIAVQNLSTQASTPSPQVSAAPTSHSIEVYNISDDEMNVVAAQYDRPAIDTKKG
jgi:hypothetical protein